LLLISATDNEPHRLWNHAFGFLGNSWVQLTAGFALVASRVPRSLLGAGLPKNRDYEMTDHDTMDVLTGVMLVAAFLGFFALCAMLVEWWDSTWRVAVEPVRSEVYGARMSPSPCAYRSWWWWQSAGCRLI
jgi:hypothetical protein